MSAPVITVGTASMSKVSLIAGENTCNASFLSDQPLIYWEARADGSGLGQGLLVEVGSLQTRTLAELEAQAYTVTQLEALNCRADNFSYKAIAAANTTIPIVITGSELTNGDKSYRINIYGTNFAGQSTPYGG